MPEYSSTTLTPTNETKVPAMQNNNSGNFQLDVLKTYILAEKAQANGLASLDATGKLVSSQIPDNLDDVLVYGSYALLPTTGVEGKIYITADTNSMYRWDASLETPDYVMLAVDLEEYATKAELQAETNQRKASDSRLEARLENLEQKAGDYTTVQYRGTNAVPTGKAKNGLVEKIVGKTRAWNQLVQNGNFADTSKWSNAGNVTSFSVSGNVATVTVNSSSDNTYLDQYYFDFVAGHKYLLVCDFYNVDGQSSAYTYCGTYPSITSWYGNPLPTGSWYSYLAIRTAESTGTSRIRLGMRDSSAIGSWSYKMRNCHMHDLTLIFGPGNEPSTVADALAQLPALGQYNAYDAGSLVDTEVSGVKSVGVNIFPYDFVGEYSYSKDYKSYNANNAFKLKAGTYYALASSSANKYLQFFNDEHEQYVDADIVTYISGGGDAWDGLAYVFNTTVTFTISRDCIVTVCVYNPSSDETLQVCLNSLPNAIKTVYHPYKTDTLSLSETVTPRSAGNVADTDELNVEVLVDGVKVNKRRQTTRIGSVDLGSLHWTKNRSRFYATISDAYYSSDNTTNLLCEKYIAQATDSQGNMWLYTGKIYIHDENYADADADAFKTAMDGVMLNYELATPVVTLSDPIPDNFIEVEGGGTIDTIQDQTPVIDNCLDVGYLAV